MNKSVIVARDVMISLKQAQIADATICKIEWNNVYVIQRVFQSPSLTNDREASMVGSDIIKSFSPLARPNCNSNKPGPEGRTDVYVWMVTAIVMQP